METIRKVWHYLTNLEWTEKKQHVCIFCNRQDLKKVVYEDEEVIAIENLRSAGEWHWLLMPTHQYQRHIRDIEALNGEDIDLPVKKMDSVKEQLIKTYCPNVPRSSIHSGYHRGRRILIGNIYFPDIISIHHIHLHVIVKPRLVLQLFKYPTWLPLMWKSDKRVMLEVARKLKQLQAEAKPTASKTKLS